MILGEDYTFKDALVESKEQTVPIELLSGPFKGVILRYTTVAVKENKNGTATLKFDYDLLKIPDQFSEKSLRRNEKFEKHVGLILNAMILEVVDSPLNTEKEKTSIDDHRTHNIKEPNQE